MCVWSPVCFVVLFEEGAFKIILRLVVCMFRFCCFFCIFGACDHMYTFFFLNYVWRYANWWTQELERSSRRSPVQPLLVPSTLTKRSLFHRCRHCSGPVTSVTSLTESMLRLQKEGCNDMHTWGSSLKMAKLWMDLFPTLKMACSGTLIFSWNGFLISC